MINPQLREDAPSITGRTLRQFAALWILLFGGLAMWQWLGRERAGTAAVLGILAVLVGLAGLARPGSIRPVFSVLVAITTPIGRVISIVVLGVMFYVLFTPIALLFRLVGRDALDLRRPSRPSHWIERPPTTDPRSYLRQS